MKDLSKQTLSNYIKETIVIAYQEHDPDAQILGSLKIKHHSIRHVATSLGALRAVSMDDVLQARCFLAAFEAGRICSSGIRDMTFVLSDNCPPQESNSRRERSNPQLPHQGQ